MSDTTNGLRRFRSLIFLLSAVWIGSAMTIASCGGGGSTNGELCDQCGESDGFCQGEMGIGPVAVLDGDDLPCDNDEPNHPEPRPCDLTLRCLRKVGDSQRRCFPVDFDDQFRCDGARPNLEVRSPSPTDTPTTTPTVTPTATSLTPTPTATTTPVGAPSAVCGDKIIDDGEECDGTDPSDVCEEFCDGTDPTAVPCGMDCKFDFSGCENPTICNPN